MRAALIIGCLAMAGVVRLQEVPTKNETEGQVDFNQCEQEGRCMKLTLDADYGVRFTIGTPPKNIKLMPAFHTHRTFVTASSCLRCK